MILLLMSLRFRANSQCRIQVLRDCCDLAVETMDAVDVAYSTFSDDAGSMVYASNFAVTNIACAAVDDSLSVRGILLRNFS